MRFFAKATDDRIFVTDMYNLTDNDKGAIYILSEFDLKAGKFTKVTPYLTGLKNPNSVQFYKDENGQNWLLRVINQTAKFSATRKNIIA